MESWEKPGWLTQVEGCHSAGGGVRMELQASKLVSAQTLEILGRNVVGPLSSMYETEELHIASPAPGRCFF